MANKRNKRKASKRRPGRPRKKTINANLRVHEVGPKRQCEMMLSRYKKWRLTKDELSEIKKRTPVESNLKWKDKFNMHVFEMNTGPGQDQANLAEKLLNRAIGTHG